MYNRSSTMTTICGEENRKPSLDKTEISQTNHLIQFLVQSAGLSHVTNINKLLQNEQWIVGKCCKENKKRRYTHSNIFNILRRFNSLS
ncbi:hypothetical protein NC652_013776 [Populus alba x Populus x berolinensis]|uniref:Uncharacterized protein n=2 Tax=Populus alba x Populus x berolinensis TaxID=444605 RepID=A0AAD6QV83_9ROSI|nr:hypothetical protein NC652_013776 [Populus alba x Populus x berolinensis]KAJ6997266.1 hypothetical protein NC653_013747 [Populus alba x Populus x berolinensis]